MSPKRIQLSRKKGWRKPEGAVVVSRPSKWGNPFRIGSPGVKTARDAVRHFTDMCMVPGVATMIRRKLRGKDLCCWCPLDQPCHADVLLEIANS